MKTGVELIAAERKRQIEEEGWTAEHDAEHDDASLALAAVCYATPVPLYRLDDESDNAHLFVDPWPGTWAGHYDKRLRYGSARRNCGGRVPHPRTYTRRERLDLLIKAGALVAAEIDRIQRKGPKS